VPPPFPTRDQLKKLAEGPRAETPPKADARGASEDLILEIHIFEVPDAPGAKGKGR